jgi:hypothetical protein
MTRELKHRLLLWVQTISDRVKDPVGVVADVTAELKDAILHEPEPDTPPQEEKQR